MRACPRATFCDVTGLREPQEGRFTGLREPTWPRVHRPAARARSYLQRAAVRRCRVRRWLREILRPIQSSPRNVSLRTPTMRGSRTPALSSTRTAPPPVAFTSGPTTSVVDVTSVNSRGLAGPTFASAVSLPSAGAPEPEFVGLDRRAPDTGLALRERQGTGFAGRRCERDLLGCVRHRLTLHREIAPAHENTERLFFEVRLPHRPVRQAPQQIKVRPAALVVARPQPDVVGQ